MFKFQFIRLPEVINLTGLSRSSIYARINPDSPYYDPSFPKQKKLSPRKRGSVVWFQHEIENWMKSFLNSKEETTND